MFCAYCQQQLPDDAVFCNFCGKRVQLSTSASSELLWSGVHQTPSTANTIPTPEGQAVFSEHQSSFNLPDETIQVLQPPAPLNALQRFLVRTFQPQLAGNALFGIIVGCIIAVIASIAASWLILTIVHFIAPSAEQTALLANDEVTIDYILGITLLHVPFRDVLQLLIAMHGASVHISYGASSYTFALPLNGLLIVPATFLIAGGYVAACTDLQDRVKSSLVRGAAIALPYTFLLLILSWQVNGNIPPLANTPNPTQGTLMVDTTTLLFFGLLWGALFGLLGASLKVARGQWRHLVRTYLRTNAHPQIAGMITGACYATALGLGLSFLTLCGLLTYTAFSIPLLERNLCVGGDWQPLLAWGIAQGPLHAVNLFFFSFGAPLVTHVSSSAPVPCFYTSLSQTGLTLRDPNLHLAPWVYALLLIPALSLFMGGRISAAIARTEGKGPNAISGALIAIPFAIIVLLLTFLSTITSSSTVPGSLIPNVQSAGTNPADLLLWALLSGACFGALGGAYQGSTAKSWSKRFLAIPTSIVELFAKPVYLVLQPLNKQPTSSLRTATRSLLYSTLTCALLLAIATTVVGWLLIADNQTITQQVNQHVRDIVSVFLIVIPGLLLFCACAQAVCRDPVEEG